MAAAPIIGLGLTAIGTVSSMSAQGRQAAAQRQSIEASNVAARQQAALMEERLGYARSNAEITYARQRELLDRQRDNADIELQKVRLETEMAARQQGVALDQAEAMAEVQLQELLSNASNIRTQGELESMQRFMGLAEALTGSREAAADLLRAQAMTNLGGATFDAREQQIKLDEIDAYQATTEAANTAMRVSEAQASNVEAQANIQNKQSQLMTNIYREQLAKQQELQNFSLQRMPSILEMQYQRNAKALEAAKYANSADLSLQSSANQQNLLNSLSSNQAAMNAVQGPSYLTGLATIGGGILNYVQQQNLNRQPQVTQPTGMVRPRFDMTPVSGDIMRERMQQRGGNYIAPTFSNTGI